MFTQSLVLHVFADNTVLAVTSGVDFLNIQVETELQPNLEKYCFFKMLIKSSMVDLET